MRTTYTGLDRDGKVVAILEEAVVIHENVWDDEDNLVRHAVFLAPGAKMPEPHFLIQEEPE